MKIWWFSLIFMLSFVQHVPINGDTYHYQVIRKICPSGTYHDPMKDKCRKVPGGGEMIKINLDARCSAGFLGLLAHSKKSRFYYVCKKDGVLTCMCKPTESFNRIKLKCDNKCNKKEGLTHEVVDHIVDKYKCSVMNGVYEEDHCVQSGYGTTEYPHVTGQSIEDFDREKITRLQNILRYLTFIRTINDRPQSFESIETTPASVAPRTIIIPIPDPTTTAEPILRFTGPPEDPENIERDINEFRRNWNLDPTTPATPATTVLATKTNVRARLLKTTTSKNIETTTTDSETTNAVKTRVSDETTTVMQSTVTESSTLASTETSRSETTTATETTLTGRDMSSGSTSEKELTTQESDALAQKDESTTEPSIDESTGKLVTRIVLKTTTDSDGLTNPVDDDEDPDLEEYFEYYYEHEPEKVLFTSNKTKLKVKGRGFGDEDEEWKQIVFVTEPDEVTIPVEETSVSSEASPIPIDETTIPNDDSVPVEKTTAEIEKTTVPNEETTVKIEETTLDESVTTELPNETTEADESRKDSIDSTTTELPGTSTIETTTEAEESTSQMPPEPLIKRNPGDLTYNDFYPADPKFLGEKTLPTTTMTFEGITPPSTRMYKYSTTLSPETTTNVDSTTTYESTVAADDQTTTDNIVGRFSNDSSKDESFEILAKQDFTTTKGTTEMSTTQDFKSLEFKDFTTENPTTTQILTSTMEAAEETTSTTEFITTDGSTLEPKDTTTIPITSTTDFTTLNPESSTILDSITTKIPRIIKPRANTEATTLNILEPTTITTPKPRKFKKVNETKTESEVKVPKISDLIVNKEEKPKSEELEFYYTYEEYPVDADGKEIKDTESLTDEIKKKVLKKTLRDNSNEYYAESISASHEDRKSNFKDAYDLFP